MELFFIAYFADVDANDCFRNQKFRFHNRFPVRLRASVLVQRNLAVAQRLAGSHRIDAGAARSRASIPANIVREVMLLLEPQVRWLNGAIDFLWGAARRGSGRSWILKRNGRNFAKNC